MAKPPAGSSRVFSALLISASPAIAGVFVYLTYDVELTNTYKFASTDRVDVEENPLAEYYKVDLANSRMMMVNSAKRGSS